MYYLIYKITNLIDNKIYIGCHKTKDINDGYMGSGKYLKHAIEKHGLENFTKEVLFVFDNSLEMFAKEKELVNEDFLATENTYNLKIGGFGGFDYINLTKTKEELSIQGKKGGGISSLLRNNRMKNDLLYKTEFYNKISLSLKKGFKEGSIIPSKNFLGKHHTEASKNKIGLSNSKFTGEKNSQFDTCWIYNLELKVSKKIKKELIKEYIASGWSKGRKMHFI